MTFNMDVRVVLIVLCSTAALASHYVDVNRRTVQPLKPSSDFVEPRHHPEMISVGRSTGDGNEAYLNEQSTNVDHQYRFNPDLSNQNIPEIHPHRSPKLQREISENIENNNNVQPEYKLRTNAYTNEQNDKHSSMEFSSSDANLYTNIKPEALEQSNHRKSERLTLDNHTNDNSSAQGPDITQHYRHGGEQDELVSIATPNINETVVIKRNNSLINVELDNYSPSNANLNNQTLNKTKLFINNNKNKTDNIRRVLRPETIRSGGNFIKRRRNDTRVIAESSSIGRNNSRPKGEDEIEEEIGWVWGNEGEDDEDELKNRAAFSGDLCPTGKVKVEGICAEKH